MAKLSNELTVLKKKKEYLQGKAKKSSRTRVMISALVLLLIVGVFFVTNRGVAQEPNDDVIRDVKDLPEHIEFIDGNDIIKGGRKALGLNLLNDNTHEKFKFSIQEISDEELHNAMPVVFVFEDAVRVSYETMVGHGMYPSTIVYYKNDEVRVIREYTTSLPENFRGSNLASETLFTTFDGPHGRTTVKHGKSFSRLNMPSGYRAEEEVYWYDSLVYGTYYTTDGVPKSHIVDEELYTQKPTYEVEKHGNTVFGYMMTDDNRVKVYEYTEEKTGDLESYLTELYIAKHYYYPSGQLAIVVARGSEGSYDNSHSGYLNSICAWYENGNIMYELPVVESSDCSKQSYTLSDVQSGLMSDRFNGLVRFYYEDGTPMLEQLFRNHLSHGQGTRYNPDGSIHSKISLITDKFADRIDHRTPSFFYAIKQAILFEPSIKHAFDYFTFKITD